MKHKNSNISTVNIFRPFIIYKKLLLMLPKIEIQKQESHKNQNQSNQSRYFHLPPNKMCKIKINKQSNKTINLNSLCFNESKIQNRDNLSIYFYPFLNITVRHPLYSLHIQILLISNSLRLLSI